MEVLFTLLSLDSIWVSFFKIELLKKFNFFFRWWRWAITGKGYCWWWWRGFWVVTCLSSRFDCFNVQFPIWLSHWVIIKYFFLFLVKKDICFVSDWLFYNPFLSASNRSFSLFLQLTSSNFPCLRPRNLSVFWYIRGWASRLHADMVCINN